MTVSTLDIESASSGEAATSPHGSLADTRIEQYEIIRLLGKGGMGEVYLARDLRLRRLVAIKLLSTRHPDLDMRFLVEAQATARCHHENIVVIHEVGAHRGRPYMVLEYLEGHTLRKWMRDHAASSAIQVAPALAVDLMLPVVRALAYAHDQGIVHRDLKPENVMLTRSGIVKVLDFGIAKLMAEPVPGSTGDHAESVVANSSWAGTLPYMSPEQVTLGAVDPRTDIWAVGIMLFELVAGVRPVPEVAAPLTALLTDENTPMPGATEHVPDLGPLARIIDRCLMKRAADRIPSARVLLAELEALVPERRRAYVGNGDPAFAKLGPFQEAEDNVGDRLWELRGDINRKTGQHKVMAVLYADLRFFTTLTEGGDPADVAERLNQYFDHMVSAITLHGGTIDKFIGDAVLAVFGGLVTLPNPAESALDAALAMRASLQQLNQRRLDDGLSPLDNGIGICFGEVLLAAIGSAQRKELTVLGDVVHTATLLEAATKALGTPIVVSDGLAAALPAERRAGLTSLGEVMLKGKSHPVTVFGAMGTAEHQVGRGSS